MTALDSGRVKSVGVPSLLIGIILRENECACIMLNVHVKALIHNSKCVAIVILYIDVRC